MPLNTGLEANGTINPSCFVTIDSSTSNKVLQSVAGDHPLGIAQEWAKNAPIPGATSEAADQGDPIKVYGLGDICYLQATTAGWTANDFLKPDANGNGVTASVGDYYGAIALTSMTGTGLGRVQVLVGKK